MAFGSPWVCSHHDMNLTKKQRVSHDKPLLKMVDEWSSDCMQLVLKT